MPLDTPFAVTASIGPLHALNTPADDVPILDRVPDDVLRRIARHLFDSAALAFAGTSRRIEGALHGAVVAPVRLAGSIPWLASPAAFRQAVEQISRMPARCSRRLIPLLDRQGALIRLDGAEPPHDALSVLDTALAAPARLEVAVECLLNRPHSLRFPEQGKAGPSMAGPSLNDVLALTPRLRARVLPKWIEARRSDRTARPTLAQWLAIVGELPPANRLRVLRAVAWHGFANALEERLHALRALLDAALDYPGGPGAFDILDELTRYFFHGGDNQLERISRAAAAMPAPQRLQLQSVHAISNAGTRDELLQIWDGLMAQTAGFEEAGQAVLLAWLLWLTVGMRHEDVIPRWSRLCNAVMPLSPAARAELIPPLAKLCSAVLFGHGDMAQWHPQAWLTPEERALTVAHLARMEPPTKTVWRQMVDVAIALPERLRYPAVRGMASRMRGFERAWSFRTAPLPDGPGGPDGVDAGTSRAPELAWPADGNNARMVLAGLLQLVPADARIRLLGELIDDELGDAFNEAGAYCLIGLCRQVPGDDARLPVLLTRLVRLIDKAHGYPEFRRAGVMAMLDIALSAPWTDQNRDQWLYLVGIIQGRMPRPFRGQLTDLLRALSQR